MNEYAHRIHRVLQMTLQRTNSGPWRFKGEKFYPSCYEVKFGCPTSFSAVDVEKQLDALCATCGHPVELIDLFGAVILRVVFKPLPLKIPFRHIMLDKLKLFELMVGYNCLGQRITWDTQNSSKPHMLCGAPTGMGKTDLARNLAYGWLKHGGEVTFIDPKRISFIPFRGIKGITIATTFDAMYEKLEEAHNTVTTRFEIIERTGNRNLKHSYIPRLIVVDEAAELSYKIYTEDSKRKDCKDMERFMSTIARLGREARCHLLYMTQYPTKELVSNQIKINLDARVCLSVSEPVESEVILGRTGAEKLGGMSGRAIFKGKEFQTIQIPYVGDDVAWRGLLAEFKTEVIHNGNSENRGKDRNIPGEDSNGSFTRTNRNRGATGETRTENDSTGEEDFDIPQSTEKGKVDPEQVFGKKAAMESDPEGKEEEGDNISEESDSSRSSDWDNLL